MSHRTQVTLSDLQYRLLRRESERTGSPLAELVRRAVSQAYRGRSHTGAEDGLGESFGAWADRENDGAEYVEALRQPGLGYRVRG